MNDGDPLLWSLLLQIFLIIINAVFSCAEIAIISINDRKLTKMAAEGNKRAARLAKLIDQPAKFLSIIQVGITLAGFLASAFAANSFSGKLTGFLVDMGLKIPETTLNALGVIVVTLILSYFTLVLGELVPKRIAMRNAEKIGLAVSGFISIISRLFSPAVWLLTASTNGILRVIGIDPDASDEEVTEEEIRLMVDAGSEKGAIDDEEREFIHNLFDFDDTTASEIMTHRTDVSLLWMDENLEQWEKIIYEDIHTIYPICGEDVDDVVGILNIKDYFRLKDKNREAIINSCIKPAFFIPETLRADILFRNMKKTRNHFAVVVDEYGGMSGIITINDLLEELVGDLDDDISTINEQQPIERVDSHTWKIQGSASLDIVSEQLGIALPDDDYDTFGGLVFDLLGTIPSDGDTPEVEGYGMDIKVTVVKSRRIVSALVYKSES